MRQNIPLSAWRVTYLEVEPEQSMPTFNSGTYRIVSRIGSGRLFSFPITLNTQLLYLLNFSIFWESYLRATIIKKWLSASSMSCSLDSTSRTYNYEPK